MHKVASPSEYLVIPGVGIKLTRKGWILPVPQVNYTFELQAMSAKKLPFVFPAVFTIGPRVDDMKSLIKDAQLISPRDVSSHVKELVQRVIIEGETRVLAASMTMEEIFKGAEEFKKEVFDKLALELNQLGVVIYNANVLVDVDVPGDECFSYLAQKTRMEAANQARIDVSEARMKGEIELGSNQREGLRRRTQKAIADSCA